MEAHNIPEELQNFLPADAEKIAALIQHFGWNLQDFLTRTPGLQQHLEQYDPRSYISPQFPNIQREEIIEAAIALYRERM